MRMMRGNFEGALNLAVEKQRDIEKAKGFTGRSAFLAGLEDVLAATHRGEHIEIFGVPRGPRIPLITDSKKEGSGC